MDALKLKRKSLRASFTVAVKAIESEIVKEEIIPDRLSALNSQLTDKFTRLDEIQQEISNILLEGEVNEVEYISDFEAAENYRDNYLDAKSKIENKLLNKPVLLEGSILNEKIVKRKFKLPKLELKQFSGEVKDWLGFWSQFSKIDEDVDMVAEDKFQYLIQAMKPGSRAASLIESFPPTAKNYPLAIEQLKDRFGREDLLVQIYVRELLNMVMKNAADKRVKTDLTSLYDQIESYLRALETLGRTQEKFADFLAPLVESCLPEDVLRAWERSRNTEDSVAGSSERSLKKLMLFLKHEVNGEEMINLARNSFGGHKETYRRPSQKNVLSDYSEVATATSLTTKTSQEDSKFKKYFSCVFCDKSHISSECFTARKMSNDDRKQILQKKGACFTCLKIGHTSRKCKSKPSCMKCGGKHYTLMCTGHEKVTKPKEALEEKESIKSNALSNQQRAETVLLQTLLVKIYVDGREKIIRAIIDSGSQRSYISEKIARLMKLKINRHEKVIHGLFGEIETIPQTHAVHVVYLSDLKDAFRCHFEVLNQPKICGSIPRLEDKDIVRVLKQKSIDLTDLPGAPNEIDLLIGADIAGKLLTGKVVNIDSGLVAVETKLGWTIFGKQSKITMSESNASTNISLHACVTSIAQLWELDSLGIEDPATKISRSEAYSQAMLHFENTFEILPDGRYQVQLPFKLDSLELLSNKEAALRRNKNMCRREKVNGNLLNYQNVFHEWLDLNIIEKVPNNETEMERFISEAQTIMAKACFNLRGWQSNRKSQYTLGNKGDVNLLGMLWNLERDTLRCNVTFFNSENDYELSKRTILSIAQRIFDPIGMLTPTTLIPKLLLQETWLLKLSWDALLPDSVQKTFLMWLKELTELSKIELRRNTEVDESSELHIFVDASKKAYASCAFLRSVTDTGVVIRLVRSKSRVAPLKTLTIPRLELMACCVGARLAQSIRNALRLPDLPTTLWSDSMVALWWIKVKGNWSAFVANRVKEIQTLTSQESWRHVPGVTNPADLLSRGCSPKQLLISQWWNGPS